MATIDANELPFIERPDLSPFVVHLTKSSKKEDGHSAYQNLVSILATGEIFGSTKEKGFIKGPSPATCFMDVPLSSLKYILNKRNTTPEDPRYGAFGVVLSKAYAYDHGCRPVLYLSNEEVSALSVPKTELWRVVRLEGVTGKRTNWLHEREWRSKGSFKLPSTLRAVLVDTAKNAQRLQSLINRHPEDFKSKPLSIIPLTVLCQGLPY